MAQSWARELSTLVGLAAEQQLELAVEEGFANAVQHAYPDGTCGPVHLEAKIEGSLLALSIRDEGVPFVPTAPSAPVEESSFRGLGLRLISQLADEVRFHQHREGKELHMSFPLPQKFLAARSELTSPPVAPEQAYQIRPMASEEGLEVARLFWLAYGYSYGNESFYRPEEMQHLIGSGKVVSFVAVSEGGEIVGHGGLIRPDPVPTAEAALMVVHPAHRGRKLMERLAAALVVHARQLKLEGLSTVAVTSHPLSQREAQRVGGVVCALELGAAPPRHFKALESAASRPQRETLVTCFMHLGAAPPAVASAPLRHRAMLSRIYEALNRPVSWLEGSAEEGSGELDVAFHRSRGRGVIRVLRSAEGLWPEIARAADDLVNIGGAEVVDLDLPLAQPATARLWERAEQAGFFFVGIRPYQARDGDDVRLKRLVTEVDTSRLDIVSELGQELLAYVVAERQRLQAGV